MKKLSAARNIIIPTSDRVKFVHYYLDNPTNIMRFKDLFTSYHGRRGKENYSESSFKQLLSENRFSWGVIETFLDDEVICFCGLCDYHDWIIISRHVTTKHIGTPVFLPYVVPSILEKIKEHNKHGLIMTFNEYNKFLWQLTTEKFRRNILSESDMNHEHFQRTLEVTSKVKTLNHPVIYRNTQQWVSYIPVSNAALPFEITSNDHDEQKTIA